MNIRLKAIVSITAGLILMAAVACGSAASPAGSPPPTDVPATGIPATEVPATEIPDTEIPATKVPATGGPAIGVPAPEVPDELKMNEVDAPIERVDLILAESDPIQYMLSITSGLPSGCAEFDGYQVSRDGATTNVAVTSLYPADPNIACTTIYGYHEGSVNLGADFEPGETYTGMVNGKAANSFTALDAEMMAMAVKNSPIETIELMPPGHVATDPDGYTLVVVSRLPLGSTCSWFFGYVVNPRTGSSVQVTVNHREVPEEDAPCTRDLPAVSTDISLGSGFISGQTYTVTVNGDTEITFEAE